MLSGFLYWMIVGLLLVPGYTGKSYSKPIHLDCCFLRSKARICTAYVASMSSVISLARMRQYYCTSNRSCWQQQGFCFVWPLRGCSQRGTLGMLFIIHKIKLLQQYPQHVLYQWVSYRCGSFDLLSGNYSSKNTPGGPLDAEKMNSISNVPFWESACYFCKWIGHNKKISEISGITSFV